MSGFSPDWLQLREPADHAARADNVAKAIAKHFSSSDHMVVLDLGCGAGSNLRGTYHLLSQNQRWLMVDHDPLLLSSARHQLIQWADDVKETKDKPNRLTLVKQEKSIAVELIVGDLSTGIAHAVPPQVDLITAAAFLDLCSQKWIEGFATTAAGRGTPVFTPLIYDGRDRFDPPHPADFDMLEAFHRDMLRDKGFGPALGPGAADALAKTLHEAGYRVLVGDSPWELDVSDTLAIALAQGFAEAVTGTGQIDSEVIERWLDYRLEHGTWKVGHTDVFAVKRPA